MKRGDALSAGASGLQRRAWRCPPPTGRGRKAMGGARAAAALCCCYLAAACLGLARALVAVGPSPWSCSAARATKTTRVRATTVVENDVASSPESPSSAAGLVKVGGGAAALAKESDGPAFSRVLEGLDDPEKYNAVLQGLSGMAAASRARGASGSSRLKDVWDLLREMKTNRISCTERSAAAVMDAAAAETDVECVQETISILKLVGAAKSYAAAVPQLSPLLPRDPKSRAKLRDGVPPLPQDDRGKEVAMASAFLGVVGFDVLGDTMAPFLHYDASVPAWLTALTAATIAADVLKGGAGKSSQVLRGLNRLFTKDQERESRAEAGAFLAAYLCGLPCFAYQPSAIEGARLVDACVRCNEDSSSLGVLAQGFNSGGGLGVVHRMLVWLLAPVASESLVHRQLIESDPRQARAFLRIVREGRQGGLELDLAEEDDEDRIILAYSEARRLLQKHEGAFEALRKRLQTGAATVGDCTSVVEESL